MMMDRADLARIQHVLPVVTNVVGFRFKVERKTLGFVRYDTEFDQDFVVHVSLHCG